MIEASAAVIVRPDGAFLLALRPPGKPYAGYWEFPGGKIEEGETPREALDRELHEELGITVEQAYPWITREFVYPHAHVRLHFFRVMRWSGELRDLHHDALEWQHSPQVSVAPVLPANAPVLAALDLPDCYAISHAGEIGVERQLALLEATLQRGLRLLQIREPNMPATQRLDFTRNAVSLCHEFGAHVLVNGDEELACATSADGLHLPAAQLMALDTRPDFPLVAASCHNAAELARAVRLGLDFVVLGPVRETASHPGQTGMGWNNFSRLLAEPPFSLPVYALGGLSTNDLESAWLAGAHGIAATRSVWVD